MNSDLAFQGRYSAQHDSSYSGTVVLEEATDKNLALGYSATASVICTEYVLCGISAMTIVGANLKDIMDNKKKDEVLSRFGKQLNALRKASNLSFRELAARCDLDHSDIKKYEDGEKDLRLLTVVELAIGLGVHPKELLNFDMDFIK